MSDDERSASSSDGEDIETTGLIATRQKRATAGNLYATLRANLDDEEVQRELLAEDEEEDAGDYEGSDKDAGDDDDAFDSSSDDEDAGPPKDGESEQAEGEKALKRQERVDARKKRKAVDARLKLPAWQKKNKRVKLADDVKTEDGGSTTTEQQKPKKKSERSNWLPTPADAPLRQSGRSLAVANREVVHANLKQSAQRSEKQRRVMKDAAAREKTKRRMEDMSHEERMKKCERVERETAREFGRWEREEAERQRLRDEALAAKRNRGIDGPVIRQWSGSVMWEGDRIKVRRINHGSKRAEEMKEDPKATQLTPEDPTASQAQQSPNPAASTPTLDTPVQAPVPWLQGIQEYAAQPGPSLFSTPASSFTPSAPALNALSPPQVHPYPHPTQQQQIQQPSYAGPQMYHGWLPGSHQFAVQPPPPPAAPPALLIREQAQRTLIVLQHFDALDAPPKRTPKYKQTDSTLEPDALKSILLGPDSHPTFTSDEQKYLTSRPRKRLNEQPLPLPPAKQRCAVTSWPAKFRDPKTGLAYADLHQYKVIQRVLAGGCQWSGLSGCWVGPAYGVMGRPAKGVPEGFAGGGVGVKTEGA